MIDAVNKVLGEEPTVQEDVLLNEAGAPIKEPTSTGMRVYGRSYGNSAKAKRDQTKSSVDDLKGPKTKELMQKDKEDYMKTKGKYDEAAKPDFLDFDKDGDKKEPMKSALAAKKKVAEELKGNQHKIDANKNNKIDAHDFAILRGKKKVKEGREFTEKLLETVRKSDVPAYLRKAKGDTPLTMADVKDPKKDTISDPKNLAKARNEEVELDEVSLKTATSAYVKRMGDDGPNEKSSIAKATKTMDLIAKKHGVRGVARATKTADDKYGLNDPVHNPRKAFVKQTMANVKKEEVESLDEKNVPTSPEKWARAKAAAKSKFAVYPSAYANGWASKKYKAMGGGWKTANEEVELTEEQLDEMINEVLGKDATAGDYIHDFVHSDNPKFDGKSKAERKKMALGAYYGAQKEAYEGSDDAITTDTLAGRMPGGRSNSFKSFKIRVKPLDKEGNGDPQKVPSQEPDETPSSNSIKAKHIGAIERTDNLDPKYGKPNTFKEATIAGTSGWKKMPATVTDKSGAVHSPMSRAKNLAQQAFKKVQDKTKIKSEMMLGKAGGTSESKKCK